MARILLLLLVTIASLLPPIASQQAATKCEYKRHSGHRYKHPVGVRKIVVDASGAGDFVSIQQAVDSVPEGNTMRIIMQINAGTYIEKVVVPASKPYVTFQGAGRDVTVVEWHDRASDRGPDGQPLRTYNTASVTILANYFNAKNISFKVSSSRLQCMHCPDPVVHDDERKARAYTRTRGHKTHREKGMWLRPAGASCSGGRHGAGAGKVTKPQSHKSGLCKR